MRPTFVATVGARLLGSALLGFGTIFQPKANATDHWSTSPRTVIVAAIRDDVGEPDKGEDGFVELAAPVAA